MKPQKLFNYFGQPEHLKQTFGDKWWENYELIQMVAVHFTDDGEEEMVGQGEIWDAKKALKEAAEYALIQENRSLEDEAN